MCDQNRYRLPPEVRIKLLDGFKWLYENRDEHFGNGRLARNVFETAIRRLADRVAGTAPVTVELLTVLHPQDIEMPDVPWDAIESVEASQRKYRTICPECGRKSRTQGDYFGRKVQCAKCQHGFTVEWGEPL
jgi:hypothetical protein